MMADIQDEVTEKYAVRIAKLLAKAESTTHQAEADSLFEKAQALMTEHNITEAMIAEASGAGTTDVLEDGEMTFNGIFMKQTMSFAFDVARFNNVRALWSQRQDYSGGKAKKYIRVSLFGFKSDITNVQMLATSLQFQCAHAMQRWAKGEEALLFATPMERFKEKREFILGFQSTIRTRLMQAKLAGEKAAAQSASDRNKTSLVDASKSVSLVVQSREQLVNDAFKKLHPHLRYTTSNISRGSGAARGAGAAAGAMANLGGGKSVGGSKKALGN